MASTYSLTPSQLSLPIPEDYKKALNEAQATISTHSYQVKRAMSSSRLMDMLKHTSAIASELRTSILSPKSYYELYLMVFDELSSVSSFLSDNHETLPSFGDIYEIVQYTGNVVPRLYLMITVGSVYIRLNIAPRREILADLLDMCRGVQHPLRGLFIREFLCARVKDQLPTSSDLEDPEGSIKDAVTFMLTNFIEMVKLWVRMQHMGPTKERDKRESERRELQELIGKNLDRISQIENLDFELYKDVILPELLEQVVSCRDVLAQEYLMEVIMQVFPNDFHLATLTQLLEAAAKLQGQVKIKETVAGIMERLIEYVENSESGTAAQETNLFEVFWEAITKMIDSREDMIIEDKISLLFDLMCFAYSCYPAQVEYVDKVLGFINDKLLESKAKGNDYSYSEFSEGLLKVLSSPLNWYTENLLVVLKFVNFQPVLGHLNFVSRRSACLTLIEKFSDHKIAIQSASDVKSLLYLLRPLYMEQEDQPLSYEGDDVVDDLGQLCKFLHFVIDGSAKNLEQTLNLVDNLTNVLEHSRSRMRFTFPLLVHKVLRQLKISEYNEAVGKRAFFSIHDLITKLESKGFDESRRLNASVTSNNSGNKKYYVWSNDYLFDTCFVLWLDSALVTDALGYEEITYDLMTKAFLTYEENVSDSKAQVNCVHIMVNRMLSMVSLKKENFDTLAGKVAVYASRLLKRPDQCVAVCATSHLFWRPDRIYRDEKRVTDCLQKAVKIADSCMESLAIVKLLIEILNHYIFYLESKNSLITFVQVNNLVELIENNLSTNIQKAEGDKNKLAELEELSSTFLRMRNSLSGQNNLLVGDQSSRPENVSLKSRFESVSISNNNNNNSSNQSGGKDYNNSNATVINANIGVVSGGSGNSAAAATVNLDEITPRSELINSTNNTASIVKVPEELYGFESVNAWTSSGASPEEK